MSGKDVNTNVIQFRRPAADGIQQECAHCRKLYTKPWVAAGIRDVRGYLCGDCFWQVMVIARDMERQGVAL